jgi:hypothetical protein
MFAFNCNPAGASNIELNSLCLLSVLLYKAWRQNDQFVSTKLKEKLNRPDITTLYSQFHHVFHSKSFIIKLKWMDQTFSFYGF